MGMRDHVPAEWRSTILICGKCSKKVKGGFGPKGRTRLAKALRALGNGKKGRKADAGIIETGCLKLCPKNAVVAIDAARPGNWLLVAPGTTVEDVATRLGLQLNPPRDGEGDHPQDGGGVFRAPDVAPAPPPPAAAPLPGAPLRGGSKVS